MAAIPSGGAPHKASKAVPADELKQAKQPKKEVNPLPSSAKIANIALGKGVAAAAGEGAASGTVHTPTKPMPPADKTAAQPTAQQILKPVTNTAAASSQPITAQFKAEAEQLHAQLKAMVDSGKTGVIDTDGAEKIRDKLDLWASAIRMGVLQAPLSGNDALKDVEMLKEIFTFVDELLPEGEGMRSMYDVALVDPKHGAILAAEQTCKAPFLGDAEWHSRISLSSLRSATELLSHNPEKFDKKVMLVIDRDDNHCYACLIRPDKQVTSLLLRQGENGVECRTSRSKNKWAPLLGSNFWTHNAEDAITMASILTNAQLAAQGPYK